MKATEFMIGDWVNWKKGNKLTPCKIGIGDLLYVEENAVAIPLTPEILEMNGFAKMERLFKADEYKWELKYNGNIIVYNFDNESGRVFIMGEDIYGLNMYIDEYITAHPEKLPEGRELMEFSAECENYIEDARYLVPFTDEHYVEKVFDICISMCVEED